MKLDEQYMERFYKKVINGKKGNLFTRVDALEEMLKHLQVRDVTQYITNLIQENKEIIIPSLVGGVTDPTDETFSGIVISPNGQTIDGVLYSFAIVVDGVVVSGVGDDGTTIIVGGTGDVISDSTSSEVGQLAIFSDTSGKHIAASYLINEFSAFSSIPLYLTDAGALTLNYDENPSTVDTVLGNTGWQVFGEFESQALGTSIIQVGCWKLEGWLSTSAEWSSGIPGLEVLLYSKTPLGVETFITGYEITADFYTLNTTPQKFSKSILFDTTQPYAGGSELLANEDVLLLRFRALKASGADVTIKIHTNNKKYLSYIKVPSWLWSSGSGDMLAATYDPNGVAGDVFDPNNTVLATGLDDGAYSGDTEDGTAGAALAFGELVYLQTSDSRWEKTDASAKATSCNKLGICVLVASGDGEPTTVLLRGNVRADAVFPAMTIGAPIYASTTAGEIQTSAPNSNAGEIIRHVGHANTADELYFNPSNDFFEIG